MNKLQSAGLVWRFLSPLPLFWRAHQVGRSFLSPFAALISRVLKEAEDGSDFTLVDLGCGHGIFLAMVSDAFGKRKQSNLKLVGIDLSEDKIAAARKAFAVAGLEASELSVKDIADFDPNLANVISILDVLYLVPIDQWDQILRQCHVALKPGGVLLLKEMNRDKRLKFQLLHLEETLTVKILGITLGKTFTFPSREEIRTRLARIGFDVEEVALDRGYHAPHMLWVARKAA
jgi:2-polyprenyl-3-methyl-5-hydroxy-6-metoxy-1,4-benzoquinol methylase